ncbi:helix-turn-helix transcriptional regulator [Bosea sp. BK604]|uniref:helix-turn-helix domain-containing protein n=1 Tax=Bosea sp. BK604 TaxID=2512180 RepID=UPI00140514D2|nr:helix-turn-helix transcriptional regulator [Bosea sp. BK604]
MPRNFAYREVRVKRKLRHTVKAMMRCENYDVGMAKPTGNRAVKWYLREWRKHRGLTQQQIADALDTSIGLISEQESGKKRMNDDWVAGWSATLEVEPIDLLRHPPQDDPEASARVRRLADAMRIFQGLPDDRQARILGVLLDIAPDEEALEREPARQDQASPMPARRR